MLITTLRHSRPPLTSALAQAGQMNIGHQAVGILMDICTLAVADANLRPTRQTDHGRPGLRKAFKRYRPYLWHNSYLMPLDNITQTNDFVDFVEKMKTFCGFLETHQSDNYISFLKTTQKQLIELYCYGQTLPGFELPENRDIEEIKISDKDIADILSFIRNRLHDPFYWAVFDPTDHEDTASVCGDLVDDLGDIYKDLKTFTVGFASIDDDVRQTALWHLKWSFDNHWNDHCVNAIYAIHYFRKRGE